jgi:hypothetical protein
MPAAPGTGIKQAELERLWRTLQPLSIGTMPLDVPPSRTSRFGSPLVLSRVHWVRPELVAEVKFLTWTDDNLLRQVMYEGLCEDKPAADRAQRLVEGDIGYRARLPPAGPLIAAVYSQGRRGSTLGRGRLPRTWMRATIVTQ